MTGRMVARIGSFLAILRLHVILRRARPANQTRGGRIERLKPMMLGHNRRMTGAECLAEMLNGYGVTHVFHVPAVLRKTMAGVGGRTDIKSPHRHGGKGAAHMA